MAGFVVLAGEVITPSLATKVALNSNEIKNVCHCGGFEVAIEAKQVNHSVSGNFPKLKPMTPSKILKNPALQKMPSIGSKEARINSVRMIKQKACHCPVRCY